MRLEDFSVLPCCQRHTDRKNAHFFATEQKFGRGVLFRSGASVIQSDGSGNAQHRSENQVVQPCEGCSFVHS